jgi:hypothetical protein
MKALLISTLIAGAPVNGGSTVDTDQMHIWFEGPAAHVECDRTKAALTLKGDGGGTDYGDLTASSVKVDRNGSVERRVICIKFN